MPEIGYAVVVWNQASHQPDLLDGSFTDDMERARQVAADELARTKSVGRGETYTVVTVIDAEEVAR